MNVASLMSKNVATCRSHDTLEQAARLMWERDIGAVPVVGDDGHLVGMITDRDICMATFARDAPPRGVHVAAAMSPRVFSCAAGDDLREVERRMAQHQVRRMPVIDGDGHPIGIISINDIARAIGSEVSAADVARTLAAVCAPRAVAASA